MIVYHGSNSNFRKLRIAKELVKSNSTLLNEGLGIYFSTDRSVAESYGKYVYTLEINDKYLLDFRKKATCLKYVRSILVVVYKRTNIALNNYIDINSLVEYMQSGSLAIVGTGKEIIDLLDSNERFYTELSQTKIDTVFRLLRAYDKKHLQAYLFPYHIQNIGVIKNVNEDIVRIINKESQ